jgi:hypothetical protein
MSWSTLLLMGWLGSAPAEGSPCVEDGALAQGRAIDGLAEVSRRVEAVGEVEPACRPVIRALERRVCADTREDPYSRAADHAGLRDLFIAQGERRSADLHCCMELALRHGLGVRALPEARREANAEYLRNLEDGKTCPRSPICPADVLAPGFALSCESVAEWMDRPIAPTRVEPVREGPVQPTPAPPPVRRAMRRAGLAMISLGALGAAAFVGALGLGAAATQQIRRTEGDERVRWDEAGRASELVAAFGGALAVVGAAIGAPLLRCSRAQRCRREGRAVADVRLEVTPTRFAVVGRF